MQFQAILTSIAVVASLAWPQVAAARSKSTPKDSEHATILAMSQAFAKNDRQRLARLMPQAKGHPLEAWAAYWELSARLDEADPTEIRAFLRRYAGTYQEDRLRNDWLLLLGKRRDWPRFTTELAQFRMNDDASVRCYSLMHAFETTQADVAAQVAQLWLDQREPDEGCAAAAELLLSAGQLKPLTAWQRTRAAFEYDKPLVARQAIGLLDPDWVATVNRIYNQPARYLSGKLTAVLPHTKELVTLALIRLAGSDTEAAAVELEKFRWRIQLTYEETSWVWGVIGKRAARLQDPKALSYFSHGDPVFMHPEHRSWLVRAALRAGDWSLVQKSIATMSEDQLRDPAWKYWRARALLALQVPQAEFRAQVLYQSIASQHGFYEQLALEELGGKIAIPPPPEPLTRAEIRQARDNPGLQRALLAIQIGLRSEGVREWNYHIALYRPGGMSERELLAAAQLACERMVWDRCINTSARTSRQVDFSQRFPMPFKQAVLRRAQEIGLDPAYVYGLIRQESRFIMDARSSVGAAGLMQVMPATARWTARKIGLHNFKMRHIHDRDTNIDIGTGYLKLVLDTFQGSQPLAAAAYNAGPSRAHVWRGAAGAPELEAAIWAENVPFPETRDYVKKVLSNTTNYAAVLTGQPQSLKARLGMVGPAPPEEVAINKDLP
ncbi:MAG: lytic transglycosylase domain-containing protein [Hylemonella sp.]|nr:lytic transglycosylase domain-containing protein [Hylemonella sp.]